MYFFVKLNLKSFIKNNTLVFTLFMLSFIFSSFATFYMYGEISTYVKDLLDYNTKTRSFILETDDTVEFNDIYNGISTIYSDNQKEIKNIKITLSDDLNTVAYIKPPDYIVNLGDYFDGSDTPQIIVGSGITGTSVKVGDDYLIGKNTYKVKGIRETLGYHEINYVSLLKNQEIEQIDVILKESPSKRTVERYNNLLSEEFSNFYIIEPIKEDVLIEYTSNSKVYIAVVLLFMAIINISYLYKYILTERKNNYAILRISGCNRLKGVVIYLSEVVILTSVQFLLSAFAYKGLIERLVVNKYTYDKNVLGLSQLGIILLFNIVLVIIIFLPIILKYSKITPKHLKYQNN